MSDKKIPDSFKYMGRAKYPRGGEMDVFFSKTRKEVMVVSDDKKLFMTHKGGMADIIYDLGYNDSPKRFVLIEKTGA